MGNTPNWSLVGKKLLKTELNCPTNHDIKEHVLFSLREYWPNTAHIIRSLPIYEVSNFSINLPLQLVEIPLPNWATEIGIQGKILVPTEACIRDNSWKEVDWFLAIFLLLESVHEREWEKRHGNIHSYSFNLKNWDTRAWDHAWVNRIAIFLNLWAKNSSSVFINKPPTRVEVTHDVDAIKKNLVTVIKRVTFLIYKMIKNRKKLRQILKIIKFIAYKDSWNKIQEIIEIEKKYGIESIFFFCPKIKRQKLSAKNFIINPSYSSRDLLQSGIIKLLKTKKVAIGLHSPYEKNINTYENIRELETLFNIKIKQNRNHWLKFNWNETWSNLETSGIKIDSTLMFNDRMGFRNSACIKWNPWNFQNKARHQIYAIPTILMDSHLYDYSKFSENESIKEIEKIILEVEAVGGSVQTLWHTHTLSKGYNWNKGFEKLCEVVSKITKVSMRDN